MVVIGPYVILLYLRFYAFCFYNFLSPLIPNHVQMKAGPGISYCVLEQSYLLLLTFSLACLMSFSTESMIFNWLSLYTSE